MPRSPLPVEHPPESLTLEPYWKQSGRWPSSGQSILANYNADSITIYMDVSKVIAERAVKKQRGFRVGHEPMRVYTSFVPMQAYTEWNTKLDPPHKLKYQQDIIAIRERRMKPSRAVYENNNNNITNRNSSNSEQRRTLAVRIERRIFDHWIEIAKPITEEDAPYLDDVGDLFHGTEDFNGWVFLDGYWRYHMYEKPDVAYRWVNDVHPCLPLNGARPQQRLARQSLQLRLHGDMAIALDRACLGVEDITPFVNEMRTRLTLKQIVPDLWTPTESPYPAPSFKYT
ncbi:hypothetical protein [Absidia glauca]|uniref:Uncharacterized protein n=1 Tax=Absidia glauca TaxID=4829 RepID=A0A163JP38_ABSGL|nr:hypothetical protein [Absidia glauca]